MNKYLSALVALLVVAGLGYGFGRYMQPAKIQIKKEEVIKEVEVVKKDVVVVEKITTNKDGTTVVERRTEDKSTERSSTDTRTKESTLVINVKPQWRVQGMVGYRGQLDRPMYGAGIERRILGPVFVGAWGNTEKQFGLSAGFEF